MQYVFQFCDMPHSVVKRLDVYYILTVCLLQHIFIAKHDRFRIGEYCVWHKKCFFGLMCRVAPLSHTSCQLPQCLLLKPPLHSMGTHQLSSLQSICQLYPMHADIFKDNAQASDQIVCTCCTKISFFAISSSLLTFTGIRFRRIRLFLFIFMWNERRSFTDVILSACNSISQSFSMNNLTVCLLVGIVSNPWNCRIPYKVRTKSAQSFRQQIFVVLQ